MDVKECSRCHIVKPASEFNKRSARPSGLTSRCKVCRKDEHYQKIYGINLDTYNYMAEQQDHKCWICKEKTKLYVDHDHETGDVRGLLCHGCNAGIGLLKESRDNMLAAIKYLDHYGT